MATPTAKKKSKTKKKKIEETTQEQELLEYLQASFYGNGNRTKMDRYRDFRAVFLGDDQGRRVLYEILALAKLSADITPPFPEKIDVNRMMILEGGRQMANKIRTILMKEPIDAADLPKRTTNTH